MNNKDATKLKLMDESVKILHDVYNQNQEAINRFHQEFIIKGNNLDSESYHKYLTIMSDIELLKQCNRDACILMRKHSLIQSKIENGDSDVDEEIDVFFELQKHIEEKINNAASIVKEMHTTLG